MGDRTQIFVSEPNERTEKWKRFGACERMVAATVVIVLALAGTILGLTIGLGTESLSEEIQPSLFNSRLSRDTTNRRYPPSDYRNYRFAAVTTDTSICSQIGVKILAAHGGSAVDAAIASMLCVGVVNTHSTGLGGGHFATIYDTPRGDTEKILVTLVSLERAPLLAHKNMFVGNINASIRGKLSIGVPGQVSGFYAAWKKFGRVPWANLVQPTIEICEKGFKVEDALSIAISINEKEIRSDPSLSELYVKADGSLVTKGDVLVDRKLAKTYRKIAANPKDFNSGCRGSLARDIVADIQERGGIVSLKDLQKYQSSWKKPLKMVLSNGNYALYNPPPPSSGVVLNFVAGILDGYKFKPSDLPVNNTLVYHRIAEAFKFGFAKRSELGDPDFVDATEEVERLTSSEYATKIRRKIDDKTTHDVMYYEPSFDFKSDEGTTHLNVLGPDGSAVAMTSTISRYFGSRIRGRRTGIIFNNIMCDFSTPGTKNYFGIPASPSNYIQPGKMPMSSMSPTIVLDSSGQVVLVGGGAGGPRIITAASFVMFNSLWFDFDLRTATDMPRVHHQLVPDQLEYELGFDSGLLQRLRKLNHLTERYAEKSVVLTIRNRCRVNTKGEGLCIEAVSDGRKGGAPDGY